MIALAKLFDRAGGICCYCGCDTYLPGQEPRAVVMARYGLVPGMPGAKKALRARMATREHLVRKADGGSDNVRNLDLACAYCNRTRGAATPEQHRAAIGRAIACGIYPNFADLAGRSKHGLWRARRNAGLSCEPPEPTETEHA